MFQSERLEKIAKLQSEADERRRQQQQREEEEDAKKRSIDDELFRVAERARRSEAPSGFLRIKVD